MPGGPLAHICFVVKDLDQAVADWKTILGELDPGQLVEPIVMDAWEAGGDVMTSATFVNPNGAEIQLLCPLNDGPLGQRLAKRGEHVHHVCFTAPDLPEAVQRLADKGIQLTSTEISVDPTKPWQGWTFIAPGSSHGTLLELAYPYKPVDGKWEPVEGASALSRNDAA
jgi:methylmalonyl-CoA/ethylmalonyl-CoA epimerase